MKESCPRPSQGRARSYGTQERHEYGRLGARMPPQTLYINLHRPNPNPNLNLKAHIQHKKLYKLQDCGAREKPKSGIRLGSKLRSNCIRSMMMVRESYGVLSLGALGLGFRVKVWVRSRVRVRISS